MRPFKTLISVDEARRVLKDRISPLSRTEEIELDLCVGRVLARDVFAPMNLPPFSRAAMDGYALRAEDTYGASLHTPRLLKIVGEIKAGEMKKLRVGEGECIKIATGALMPEGADAVVAVEETVEQDCNVKVLKPVYPRANVSMEGADVKLGEKVMERDEVLNPPKISLLASMGIRKVEVYQRPRVAIVSTGNEIVELGSELGYGKVYDCNSHAISAIVRENGGDPTILGIFEDTVEDNRRALNEAMSYDLIIFSGGSSVGERDILPRVVEENGELIFHGVRSRPAKPVLFGIVNGKPVIGLPGYPASCMIACYVYIRPIIRRMAHLPAHGRKMRVKVAHRIPLTVGNTHFIPVKIRDGMAYSVFKESGTITSISHADGILEVGENVSIIEEGEEVEVELI